MLGPNGSGKSTTLKIILGLVSPTRGTAEIFGRDSRLVASRERVGFLPGEPVFLQVSHCSRDAALPRQARRIAAARASRARIDELLELVGLTSARDRRLSGYSKGMLQRIGLAQALVHEPQPRRPRRTDCRRRSRGLARYRESNPRSETPRRHRPLVITSARPGAGSLRSRRHSREWRARSRRSDRRSARRSTIRPSSCSRTPRLNCSRRSQRSRRAPARASSNSASRTRRSSGFFLDVTEKRE